MKQWRVGLVQAELRWREPEANREHLERLLDDHGAPLDLAVLPETFTTGFLGDTPVTDEGMDGPTVAWMRGLAEKLSAVVTGSAVIMEGGDRYNRLIWAQPDGEVRSYDKAHLFAYGGEQERYRAGSERLVFSRDGWRVCPQVCYDLRFPVWCRNRGDYDLLLFVANWPTPRVQAWTALLRARAIENQAYVVAVNRVGVDGKGVAYPGCSVAFDPLGEPLVEAGDEEGVATCVLDGEKLERVRREFPFLADADSFWLGEA